MPEFKAYFKKFHIFILDTLFTIKCLSCGKEGQWICAFCFSRIPLRDEHVCGVCEKVSTPSGLTCVPCKKKGNLDGMIVATSYANPLIAKAVHLFKYGFVSDLHIELGNILVKELQKNDISLPDIIIPIPLHPRRLRWRGFNQSSLLAKHISENLLPHMPIESKENILTRTRYTPPQMQIKNYSQRKENIRGAFSITDAEKIKNKIILLVDDIATTGSTIFECARVLKNAGAKEVYAVVIARQEIKDRH
jgi:competence protein ComFC